MILAILTGLVVLTAASHQQSGFDESNTTLSTPQDAIHHLDMEIKALKGKMEKNGKNGVLESTIYILQQMIQTMEWMNDRLSKRCFFRATFKEPRPSCEAGKTVIFNLVETNTGNAYNPTTGVFTAPYRGDYVLAYQTFTYGSADANWDLYINDQLALRGRSVTSYDTGNESVLPVTLQAGDRVYVKSRFNLVFYGTHHSFFSGWLVSAF